MRSILTAVLALVGLVPVAAGEAGPAEPESDALRYFYGDYARKNLLAAAEQMPEDDYAFRPTPEVRTFAQLLGHVADTQYLFCSAARGQENPRLGVEAPGKSSLTSIEKTARTKAEVVRALRESFTYCDGLFAGLKDRDLARTEKLLGQEHSEAMITTLAIVHLVEHYGQVTVYLRLKGQVPPSSR